MWKRILSHCVFWPFMAVNVAASTVVVVLLYLPWVALKAVMTAIRSATKRRASERATDLNSAL